MSEPAENTSSRRRFPRIHARNAILVTRHEGVALEDIASTRSIGVGGCGFISRESFGRGSDVQLLISIGHNVVRASARIVYEEPLEDGSYDIGVEYTSVEAGDLERIEALVEYPPSA